MLITDRRLIETIGMGAVLRWLGHKAEMCREASLNPVDGLLVPPFVEKLEVRWVENDPEHGTYCDILVRGIMNTRCGVRVPVPFEWEDARFGALDFGNNDMVPKAEPGAPKP